MSNASCVVERSTNLTTGPWLPVRHLMSTGAVASLLLPHEPALAGYYRVGVTQVSLVPTGMALVPAGSFAMGDPYQEGYSDERPVHGVFVSPFFMDQFEVSNAQMRDVLQWAYGHGLVGADNAAVTNTEGDFRPLLDLAGTDHGYPYTWVRFTNGVFFVAGGMEDFPCAGMTWHGAAAFCNYRSDREGLPRAFDFANWTCNFSAAGYRLPTEAEWEKAGRGGQTGHHYPWASYGGTWGQHYSANRANCLSANHPYWPWTTPVGYFDGAQQPAGPDMANGYGLYDMSGNVWEWCWDYYQDNWYSESGSRLPDTRGPNGPWTGTRWLPWRVMRGGSVGYYESWLRCSLRNAYTADFRSAVVGFRCVRPILPAR